MRLWSTGREGHVERVCVLGGQELENLLLSQEGVLVSPLVSARIWQ